MGLTRSVILRGPAKISYDSMIVWTPDDIEMVIDDGGEERVSSMFGPVDTMVVNPKVTVTFTPQAVATGVTQAQLLAKFCPAIFTNGFFGASYIGTGSEVALVIWATGGEQVTIHNAVITGPPVMNFSANKPLLGPVTITGICKTTSSDIKLGVNNSLYTVAEAQEEPAGAFIGLPSFLQARYTGVLGTATGFTEIYAEDGWTVSASPRWRERKIQGLTVDFELTGMDWVARCVPAQPSMKQVMDLHAIGGTSGASWGQGALMSGQQTTHDLSIKNPAGATVFTLVKPILRSPGFRFGYDSLRVGELGWHNQVRFAAGAAGALAAWS